MNACINYGECMDTGCMCPERVAKVAPIKASSHAHISGDCDPDDVYIDPLRGWKMGFVWGFMLVMGLYSMALTFTGLVYLYQQIFGA